MAFWSSNSVQGFHAAFDCLVLGGGFWVISAGYVLLLTMIAIWLMGCDRARLERLALARSLAIKTKLGILPSLFLKSGLLLVVALSLYGSINKIWQVGFKTIAFVAADVGFYELGEHIYQVSLSQNECRQGCSLASYKNAFEASEAKLTKQKYRELVVRIYGAGSPQLKVLTEL